MTGFATLSTASPLGQLHVEIRSLNHRSLDLKLRMPREFTGADHKIRAWVQAGVQRGSVDLKIERRETPGAQGGSQIKVDLELAARYLDALKDIQNRCGLSDSIATTELSKLPGVMSVEGSEFDGEQVATALEPVIKGAIDALQAMRRHEGATLAAVLLQTVDELEGKIRYLREARALHEARYRETQRARVAQAFADYPIPAPTSMESTVTQLLESRIAQELALLLDRTDIEEELVRFQGHLDHIRKTLAEGGPVGRKLEFILQELNREINTLGNKALDIGVSHETIPMKVRIEQLREQVMNLE